MLRVVLEKFFMWETRVRFMSDTCFINVIRWWENRSTHTSLPFARFLKPVILARSRITSSEMGLLSNTGQGFSKEAPPGKQADASELH